MSPKISVVIPTYNRPNLLSRAIKSVLDQTYTDYECIVVDDASPADSLSVVDDFDDGRIQYLEHETNQGASAARNTGIANSKGEYIAFLDDDDEWISTKLEKQVDLFSQLDSEYGLVYCWMDYRENSDGNVIKKYRPTHQGYIFPQMLDGQVIGSSSTLLVRKKIAEQTLFDESLPRGNDGDFIRRICRNHKVEYVPETLVNYYVDHGEERITNESEDGIQNAIGGQKIKFDKFGEELNEHPERAAHIYTKIAIRYAQLNDWNSCKHYHWKAIKKAPMSVNVYKSTFHSLRYMINR